MDRSLLAAGAAPITTGLASAVLGLGDTFELEVVAEGIEYPEQSTTLRDLGCETGQGFFFARPMPPAALLEFLSAGARGRAARSSAPATSPARVNHSYEGLDRPGGFARGGLLAPLRAA